MSNGKLKNKSAEAGQKNLMKWKAEHPEEAKQAAFKHGAHSKHVRKRYADKRTREGKQLESVLNSLVDDLGGRSELSAAQLLVLENIRSKLIVLFQIGQYIDRQESIIDDKGQLLPCLGRGYTAYSEALRRDLEALFSIKRKATPLTYELALKNIEAKQ